MNKHQIFNAATVALAVVFAGSMAVVLFWPEPKAADAYTVNPAASQEGEISGSVSAGPVEEDIAARPVRETSSTPLSSPENPGWYEMFGQIVEVESQYQSTSTASSAPVNAAPAADTWDTSESGGEWSSDIYSTASGDTSGSGSAGSGSTASSDGGSAASGGGTGSDSTSSSSEPSDEDGSSETIPRRIFGGGGGASSDGRTWYSSPNARYSGLGTLDSPAPLEELLKLGGPVKPGDTVVLLEGVYRQRDRSRESRGFVVSVAGEEDKPVTIRGERGKRVTIDGRITVVSSAEFIILRDLEIMVSENLVPANRVTYTTSDEFDFPGGGLWISGGRLNRFVNLVIHDNASGIYFWQPATDSEVYGCIIYDNGWQGPDRGHGHAIYSQNRTGYKFIVDCIMTGGYGFTMHGFTEVPDRFVNNYLMEGNIVYNSNRFLAGGHNPSSNIMLYRNYFYNSGRVEIGYHQYEGRNENCIVAENLFVDTPLEINRFDEVLQGGNVSVDMQAAVPQEEYTVVIRANRYDADRAHVAVYNWHGQAAISVDMGDFIREGDRYRFMDPTDFYGDPVHEGFHNGGAVTVPVSGHFAAYVLLVDRM